MATESPAPPKTEDVEMSDVPAKEEEEADTSAPSNGSAIGKKEYETMKAIVEYLSEYKESEDAPEVAISFQRLVNKRFLPDYYQVVKKPIAFSTIRGKILKKEYKSWKEYVADFAQIVHNAQVYNRPSAPVFSDANKLRELMKLEFAKLVQQGVITAEEAEMPDLGPLPEFEDSPPPPPGQEQPPSDDEPEEEEEEEEDEEDDDDSDNEGKRKKKRGPRTPATAKREGKQDGTQDDAAHKKRGRPPKVFTPMEARINNILKGLRRPKDKNNDLMVLHFEKVPDKSLYPEYHQMFPNPIALDIIKRKAKRKKYSSVDAVMKDVELMFENAKAYNQDGSEIWECAVHLQQEARKLAEQEKAKPDSAYVDDDGRLPLAEILHNGEVWKVGDWVHLQNPNDLNKPIVAQIYRTWQDADGQKWINACWYYRPEQTVHSFEKHFLENEVMKTGQYRDHHVDEIVDRCFVMFVTRFFKGRPRGFPADKEVYVCEARYNEENCKINKIKTWASCVPDEVREKDYEMDLFDMPRKMKKYPSPIKHLLRDDAKPDDPLPKPTWGSPNAPPIVGAVHRRPREANESPPPEPTPEPPSPMPAPPDSARRSMTVERATSYQHGSPSMANHPQPTPSPITAHSTVNNYNQQPPPPRPSASPAPVHNPPTYSMSNPSGLTPAPPTPAFPPTPQTSSYARNVAPAAPSYSSTPSHAPLPPVNHDTYGRSIPPPRTSGFASSTPSNVYNPNDRNQPQVYMLPDHINAVIPEEVRKRFHRDAFGRILFFTAPPLDTQSQSKPKLAHSLKYLAKKARDEEAKRAKLANQDATVRNDRANGTDGKKRVADDIAAAETELSPEIDQQQLEAAMLPWLTLFDEGTNQIFKNLYGSQWQEVKNAQMAEAYGRIEAMQKRAVQEADGNPTKKSKVMV